MGGRAATPPARLNTATDEDHGYFLLMSGKRFAGSGGRRNQMAKRGKKPADGAALGGLDGIEAAFLAEEDGSDRRLPWRLALWGAGAVGAMTLAALVNQSSLYAPRERGAAAELARQSERIQALVRDNRNDIRRLSAAIDTLNGDRDRLYARATALEQGLESASGTLARHGVALSALTTPPRSTAATDEKTAEPAPAQAATSSPPVVTAASTSEEPAKPDTADTQDVTAAIPAAPGPVIEVAAPRTAFGVDLGAAGSIEGLRALWHRMTAAHKPLLADLRPVIAVRERRGPTGVQLRLVAGPLDDAAAAARICAAIAAARHACTTTTFEGQRLALDTGAATVPHPPARRPATRHVRSDAPATQAPPAAAAR